MDEVRSKLEAIERKIDELERNYEIFQIIAEEFYATNRKRAGHYNNNSHEKGYRANQDGYIGSQRDIEKSRNEIRDKSRVSDIPDNSGINWSKRNGLHHKFSTGVDLQKMTLILSLLMYLILAVLVWATRDMDIPFQGYKWK